MTVALDIKPGKLFHGRVHSIGWGVSQGDEAPTGQLSTMPADQGWLRDPQRFPVRILVLPDEAKEAGHRRRAQRRAGQRHHLHQGQVDHESDRPAVDQGRRPAELPAIAMATALPSRRAAVDPVEAARLHFVLRFSVGTTAAFVVCEWMGWQPSALAPVLTGVLLASLPVSPPPKVGLALVIVMGDFGLVRLLSDDMAQPDAAAPVRSHRPDHVPGLRRAGAGERRSCR